MKNKFVKRLLSFVLSLAIVFGMVAEELGLIVALGTTAAIVIIAVFGASPVVVVIGSAVAGLVLGKFGLIGKKKEGEKK